MNYFTLTLNNNDHYKLIQPEWLWLIPLFFLIKLFLTLNRYTKESSATSILEITDKNILMHPLYSLFSQTKSIKQNSKHNIIYYLCFILIVISLAQPVKIGEKRPEPSQQHDITFIVDTSVSMILRDYILNGKRIDRMSLLKGVLDGFISELKGQKMSIIVFGDKAYTLVPLTSDQSLLKNMLSRVQATMAGRFNAIGDAIALAVQQSIKTSTINKKRKRVLVLLTDADQPTGEIDPYAAAELASKYKLPLYTIAIGATTLAAEESRLGGLLYSPVDLELIHKLSAITGAKSFQAGSPKALVNAIQSIKSHETNNKNIKPLFFEEPLYHWLLVFAFILFTLNQITIYFNSTLKKEATTSIRKQH